MSKKCEKNQESQELKEYFDLVDNLVENKINFKIMNGSDAHAEYLISKMIRYAKRKVNIFTGILDKAVYGSERMKDSLFHFCRNHMDGKINIIIQNLSTDEIKQHPLYKFAEEKRLIGQCSFYLADDDDRKSNHFCT